MIEWTAFRGLNTNQMVLPDDSVAECTAGRGERRGADLDGACVCVVIKSYYIRYNRLIYGRSNQTHNSPLSMGVPDYRMAILA